MLTMPRPSLSVRRKSCRSSAGSPKKLLGALFFESQEPALNGADGRFRDEAIFHLQLIGAFPDFDQQRPQILEIEEEKPFIVRVAEGEGQYPFLGLVEIEEPREQQGSHFSDGGADGVALLAA